MAEKLISPGVFTQENDLSFVPQGIGEIGGAIVGPTVKGPALVPTKVTSYPEYVQLFGDTFVSGSTSAEYLTSISAKEYLKHSGALTVVRILGDGYSNASASVTPSVSSTGTERSSGSFTITTSALGDIYKFTSPSNVVTTFTAAATGNNDSADGFTHFFAKGADAATQSLNLAAAVNSSSLDITAVGASALFELSGSALGTAYDDWIMATASAATGVFGDVITTDGGANSATAGSTPFIIKTHADGLIANSSGSETTNNILTSGSSDNLRYEITNVSEKKGTFTLLIRRGDDTSKRKVILETWSGLSLDPNSNNFISKTIGDQFNTLAADGATEYLQPTGNFPNKSKYVYVAEVNEIPNYLDGNGNPDAINYKNLPKASSGSFRGGLDGTKVEAEAKFFEKIEDNNVQGLNPTSTGGAAGYTKYTSAINLLSNADEYDVNMIWMPGITAKDHSTLTNKLITTCETRGDCFAVIDPCLASKDISVPTTEGEGLDTSYAAMYWPWVQTSANGKYCWVPPSTLIPGIYAFNDKVAAEWYAPAGLNRGGLETVVQAERKLTHANRDTLYEGNINPLATFPGEGVVVWGQKTLQKKASALDRVNVRRLLINLKKFIASTSKYLVFENNTAATRNRFLGSVNPYMESVQQNQGLYAFKVVMDESNNTADLIDRNIMKGEIYLQPAKAAEFIVVDFNIMPTGATFED